ncbi:MAG TPA: methyltransferase domain-containing protein [Vulgatibacter sp.]|nr:methyltransferase domain-containing protein [Vulgatibacter sp.]
MNYCDPIAPLGGLLPRHLFLEPLLAGARVLELGAVRIAGGASATSLHDRGAASVATVDLDAEAIERARADFGGPGLRFVEGPIASLEAAAFDLAILHGASWLDELDDVRRALAPAGRLAVALDGPASYGEVAAILSARFPSVEVATIRPVAGWAMAPVQVPGAPLAVDDLADEPAPASQFVFVCGESPAGLATRRLAILPREATPGLERMVRGLAEGEAAEADAVGEASPAETLRTAESGLQEERDGLRAEAASLRSELETLRAAESGLQEERDGLRAEAASLRSELETLRSSESRLREERDELRAEIAALRDRLETADARDDELAALEAEAARARASAKGLRDELAALHAGAVLDVAMDRIGTWGGDDALARRARDAEERAEMARLRLREAEESMRAAERRAEAAEGQRAEAVIAARRLQLELERTRRAAALGSAGRQPSNPE